MTAVEKVSDLTPPVLQDLLRHSLGSPSLTVTSVREPEELGGINTNYGSDLRKLVVTVEEEGRARDLHLVAKSALQTWAAWANVWLNLFIFYRESFWFSTALPELGQLVEAGQAAALAEVVPRVHLAYCNYQEDDLCAYHTVLATYMEDATDFAEFKQEVQERRVYGMVMFSKFFIFFILDII